MAVHTYLQSIEKARRGRRERKAATVAEGYGETGKTKNERGNRPGEATECSPPGLAAEGRGSHGHLPPLAASDLTWTHALSCHECKCGISVSLLSVAC